MYLVDIDVLLHATISSAAHHQTARTWLNERLSGHTNTIGLAWPILIAFIEATTGPGLLDPPATSDQAWTTVTGWLHTPATWTPTPGSQHAHLVTELLTQTPATGRSVWAIHVAALAREHGLTLATSNLTYQHLNVRHYNPLTGRPWHQPTVEPT